MPHLNYYKIFLSQSRQNINNFFYLKSPWLTLCFKFVFTSFILIIKDLPLMKNLRNHKNWGMLLLHGVLYDQ